MSADHVLVGKDGWLFLGEGTNSSISQMTGARKIDRSTQNQWRRAFSVRELVFGDRALNVICPEKTCVYPQFLPDGYRVSPHRFTRLLERERPSAYYPFVDGPPPIEEGLVYVPTDTHFTDFGAHFVAQEIAERLSLPVTPLPTPTWVTRPVLGDLGSAVEPQQRSDNLVPATPLALDVSENGLRNRGRVARYERRGTGPKSHVLVFGDSFTGTSLGRFLAMLVGRVTFVHSLAFDYELVERLQPDAVIGEMAERFLMDPPAEGRSLGATILEKFIQGMYTPTMLQELTRTLDDYADVYGNVATAQFRKHLSGVPSPA